MEKIKWYLSVVIISLVSTLVSGYQFAVSDQEIFIPYILKFQDQSLFKDDILFSQFTANASFFYQILAFITKFVNIETVFFLGFIFAKAVLFIGIYQIAELIFKNRKIALLSLMPFLIPKFIGGTATLTFDMFFGYRSIGVIFLVFYLVFILKNQFNKASLIAGVCLFFHPLSIIPSILLLPVFILKNSKNKTRDIVTFIMVSIVFALSYQLYFHVDSNILFRSTEWLSIIKDRDDYIFISLWGKLGWLSLFLYTSLVAVYLRFAKGRLKNTLIIICLVSLFVFITNFLIIDVLQFPGFTKFQLARSITPIAMLGLILSPSLLLFDQKKLKFFGFISFAALSLNLFYVFLIGMITLFVSSVNSKSRLTVEGKRYAKVVIIILIVTLTFNLLYLKNMINFPLKADDWTKVQIWANKNTKKDAKFLVPPQENGFRIFSSRPIVGDIKDGAVVIYNDEFARKWNDIMKDTNSYSQLSEGDFIRLKEKYSYDFLVVRSSKKMSFEKIYENNTYSVYRI